MIDRKTDAKDVATNVGDAIFRHQLGAPTLGIGMAEGEEAGLRRAAERIGSLLEMAS